MLIALGVVVLIVVGVITAIVEYSRSHQDLVLPPAGQTIPTTPIRPSQDKRVDVSTLYVKQGSNQRQAEFYLPLDRTAGQRLPVIVLLHGHSGNGGLITQEGDWEAAVEADHLIVLTPEGVQQSWNAGACCRLASTLGIQDEKFLDALVNDLRLRPEVDPSRIYMVGESNGGIMTYRYLCDHAAKLAGAASVVGTNIDGCRPSAPIPIMHVAGTADAAVPYKGGRTSISIALATKSFPPVVASVKKVAAAEGCGDTPAISSESSRVRIQDWSGCRNGSKVRLVTVSGMAHEWPRAPLFDGTTQILRFFGLAS
jgi:polyhydroxybutyrate depolymerase